MAKSDLLKEAIADARAVKETALANAKIALQEAFAPRIESMLAAKLSEELEDEESFDEPMDAAMEPELDADAEIDGDEVEFDLPAPAGKIEYTPDAESAAPVEDELAVEPEMAPEEEYNEDLDLESIIRELEGGEEATMEESMEEPIEAPMEEAHGEEGENIDDIIEAILREEEVVAPEEDATEEELKVVKSELEEAYKTVRQLKSIINEVNLLNAKLLYTNKLFRNFDLVIIDEAHYIQNAQAQRTKLINSFAKDINRVWLLTGTPMTSRPMNYFNLLNLIESPVAQNWMAYAIRYCQGYQFNAGKRKIWNGYVSTKSTPWASSHLLHSRAVRTLGKSCRSLRATACSNRLPFCLTFISHKGLCRTHIRAPGCKSCCTVCWAYSRHGRQ